MALTQRNQDHKNRFPELSSIKIIKIRNIIRKNTYIFGI
jgi:hypothetical protein